MTRHPASVCAKLLDEGRFLCSVPTMYRLLRAEGEVREPRQQATHPASVKPDWWHSGPNRVWSWDITKLLGPAKWTHFCLSVIIHIYSRYVPGWLLAHRESVELAEHLPAEAIRKQNVAADQLTIHSDWGPSMASKPVALLLANLGITKSHCRPHCSNDNPYSEARFKTLKDDCVIGGSGRLPAMGANGDPLPQLVHELEPNRNAGILP